MSWNEEPLKSKKLHEDTILFMKIYETWLPSDQQPEDVILRVDKQIKALQYLWETEYENQSMWNTFADWLDWLEEMYEK